ncbi:MAG: efflux RND transporter periplasmic adaptor subunit [Planctomycetes bacterium]|nr:efflux RND transporter periplasmic adaptor subunit [Planctomycetota bacterium]
MVLLIPWLLIACRSEKSEAIRQEPGPKPDSALLVEVTRPSRGSVQETITLSGDLQTEYRVDLTSQVSGIVAEVRVKEGVSVHQGDPLVQLDGQEARLSVRERELAHRDAQERARSAALDRNEAERTEALRELALQKAERELQRIESIVASSSRSPMSEEEVEAKRFARDEARIAHETASLARQRSEVAAELATIAVDQAKAALDRATLDLERASFRAPFDGVLSYVELRPGELVQPGTRVAEIVSPNDLYTELRVPQRRLGALELGQRVWLEVETLPSRRFSGHVETIHPTVDPEQGTVKVRVRVDDTEGLLRPGGFVSATIVLTSRDGALLVPKRARLFEGDESVVYVVRRDRAVRVPLRLGLQTVDALEVLGDESGLRIDDRVIVRGQTQVRDGDPVRVRDSDGEPTPEVSRSEGDRSRDG